jgi:magnesium-transporting ATPase (P-type)
MRMLFLFNKKENHRKRSKREKYQHKILSIVYYTSFFLNISFLFIFFFSILLMYFFKLNLQKTLFIELHYRKSILIIIFKRFAGLFYSKFSSLFFV